MNSPEHDTDLGGRVQTGTPIHKLYNNNDKKRKCKEEEEKEIQMVETDIWRQRMKRTRQR